MTSNAFEYDIAISFAGEDREIAEAIARYLHRSGVQVFYDQFQKSNLWGKDLIEYLADIYGKKSRYCLMIISKHYPIKHGLNTNGGQLRRGNYDRLMNIYFH